MALMDSTSLKVSNDILFTIFGPRDQKIWFIKDLDQIWFQILIQIGFKSREGHVALFYWQILVHVDEGCEPLDLMKIGRTGSARTPSLKWSVLGR
jgi:hypothetical protein